MSDFQVVFEWIAIIFLVALSGLFSGLNLGLMGLNPLSLEIVMGGDHKKSKLAKQIKPLRDCGNWLLCTLLFGNVAVNAALSILLADKFSALVGFLGSTIVIVIFGEIIPQALCSKYALEIGSKTRYIVWFLMFLMSFVAYPIAMILDKLLGAELGTVYTAQELRKLVDIHAKHDGATLTTRTANIMKGALNLQETHVRDVMTTIQDVFWLHENSKLTFDVLTQIFKSGHSRIPIMRKQSNNTLIIAGMLYAKDLILLDPEDEISVLHVMNAFRYNIPLFISANATLDQCLKIFVHSRQHLCMVKEDKEENKNYNDHESLNKFDESLNKFDGHKTSYFDEYLRNYGASESIHEFSSNNEISIGIITLEDVIELALQTELVDEHDIFVDHKHMLQTNRLSRINWSMLQMFDHRQQRFASLPPQELQAVYHFLSQSIKVFMPKYRKCSESSIKNLLASSSVVRVDVGLPTLTSTHQNSDDPTNNKNVLRNQRDPYRDIEDNGLLLYQRNKKTDSFALILDGKCEIYAGRQGFKSTLSRWSFLCPDALFNVQKSVLSGKPLLDYVPDFTCKVLGKARVLRIKLYDFKACIEGKYDEQQPLNIVNRSISEQPPIQVTQHVSINDNAQNMLSQSMGNISININNPTNNDSEHELSVVLDAEQYRYKTKSPRLNN